MKYNMEKGNESQQKASDKRKIYPHNPSLGLVILTHITEESRETDENIDQYFDEALNNKVQPPQPKKSKWDIYEEKVFLLLMLVNLIQF